MIKNMCIVLLGNIYMTRNIKSKGEGKIKNLLIT